MTKSSVSIGSHVNARASKSSSYGVSVKQGFVKPRMITSATHQYDLTQSEHVSPNSITPNSIVLDRVSIKSQLRGNAKNNFGHNRLHTASVRAPQDILHLQEERNVKM